MKKKTKKKEKPLLKLDLGCGETKKEGFTGVDKHNVKGVDVVCDLMKFPWPWANDSVEEVYTSHFFEHVPGRIRGQFMDEMYRVMTVGAKATILCPYWSSTRAIQDFTHEWPPIAEQSFLYFNKGWREQNKLGHYLCSCDFDFTFGYIVDQATAGRNPESQAFYIKHYLHTVSDVQVVLTKRGVEQTEKKG